MTYNIVTKDGIIISNIPPEIPRDDPQLKAQVEQLRASGQKSATFQAQQAPQAPVVQTQQPQQPGIGQQIMQGLGEGTAAVVRGGVKGAANTVGVFSDPLVALANTVFGTQGMPAGQAVEMLMTKLGVPEPKTAAAKFVEEGTAGLVGAAGDLGIAQAVKGVAPAIGAAMGSEPVKQLAGGIGAALGAEGGREIAQAAGAGPVVQGAASLAGGLMGGSVGASTPGTRIVPGPKAPLKEAAEAGINVLTTDVKPPFATKWVQSMFEKIPFVGTGGMRKNQQAQRVNAVQNLMLDYNVTGVRDARDLSTDVTFDLINKRADDLTKWTAEKRSVIDSLSIQPSRYEAPKAPQATIEGPKTTAPKAIPDNAGPIAAGAPNPQKAITDAMNKPLGNDPNFVMSSPTTPDVIPTGSNRELVVAPSKAVGPVKVDEPPRVIYLGSNREMVSAGNRNVEAPGQPSGWTPPFNKENVKTTQGEGATGKFMGAMPGQPQASVPPKYVVPVDRTVKQIDDSVAYLNQLSPTRYGSAVEALEDWKADLQGKDLSSLEDLRKDLSAAFDSPELTKTRSKTDKIIDDIYGTLNEDMGDYIKANGNKNDFTKWKVANTKLSQMAQELKVPILKRVIDRGEDTPEVVNSMLFSTNKSDVETLYRNLTEEGQAAARTAIIAKAAEDSGNSPTRFAKEVDKLSNQVGVFFKPDQKRYVEGLARVLEMTGRAEEAMKNPNTGMQTLIPGVFSGLGAFFGHGFTGFAGGLAAMSVAGGAARLYESAPIRNLVMALPSVKRGSTEEVALFKRLWAAAQNAKE